MTEPAELPPKEFLFGPPVPEEKPLYRFGDIVAAPWLVGTYTDTDARRLQIMGSAAGGGQKVLVYPFDEPPAANEQASRFLAHVDDVAVHGSVRRGMILTDTCEILRKEKSGRIRIAPVADLPTEAGARARVLEHIKAFDRFVVAPAQDPEGIGFRVDLPAAFALSAPALRQTAVVLRPTNADVVQAILGKWSANATRHGPDVFRDGVIKLAKLIEANGDSGEIERLLDNKPDANLLKAMTPLERAIALAWQIDGTWLDQMADDLHDGRPPQEAVQHLLTLLAELRDSSQAALASLSEILPPARGES